MNSSTSRPGPWTYVFYPWPLALTSHLQVGLAPFDRPKWDIVVLHPRGLLPDGETLPIARGRYFQTQTSQPAQNAPVTWTYWTASGDQLISSSNPKDFF